MSERPEFHPLPPEEDKTEKFFPARKVKRVREAPESEERRKQILEGEVDLTEELDKDQEEKKEQAV